MKTILIAAITMFGLATAIPAFAATMGGTQQLAEAEQRGNQESWGKQDSIHNQFAHAEGRGNQENWGKQDSIQNEFTRAEQLGNQENWA